MLYVSLVSLFVYLFGAYAYGASTVFALKQASPVWASARPDDSDGPRRIDNATLALFVISTAWFVLHMLIEFRNLTGGAGRDWLDLCTFIVFLFPPVIMHTVYREAVCDGAQHPGSLARYLLVAMYLLSPAIAITTIAVIFGLLVVPITDIGPLIGITIGVLFILASLYSTVLMLGRPRGARTPDQQQLRHVMIGLFIALGLVFTVLLFKREGDLLVASLDRVSRSAPIYFLIASVYFENRFAFYDLVVKRALLILVSVVVLGLFFVGTVTWLDQLPGGAARPWLFAVALAPVAMALSWLHSRAERWLDRMWLGREFTPVEAV